MMLKNLHNLLNKMWEVPFKDILVLVLFIEWERTRSLV